MFEIFMHDKTMLVIFIVACVVAMLMTLFFLAVTVYQLFKPLPLKGYIFRRVRLYTCTKYYQSWGNVTGVIKAGDYERAVRKFWRRVRKGQEPYPGINGPVLNVSRIMLFYNAYSHDLTGGNPTELKFLLQGCEVEKRAFEVPCTPLQFSASEEVINWKHFLDDRTPGFREWYQIIHGRFAPKKLVKQFASALDADIRSLRSKRLQSSKA